MTQQHNWKNSSSSPRAVSVFVPPSVILSVGEKRLREGYGVKECLWEQTVIFLSACIGGILWLFTSDGLHSWVILLCSVDYTTITLQLCKQKKCFMFYYRNIVYVGIVWFDVYPTNSPSNKQHHHGEPFAATAAWLKQIGLPHPRGPLCKGLSEVAVKGF